MYLFLDPSETVPEVEEPSEFSPRASSSLVEESAESFQGERSSLYMETFHFRHEQDNLRAELNLKAVKSLHRGKV